MKTNYPQSPTKRKRAVKKALIVVIGLVLLFFAGRPILNIVFRADAGVGGAVVGSVDSMRSFFNFFGAYFLSRNALTEENRTISEELALARLSIIRERDLTAENAELRALLGRRPKDAHGILAEVLVRPPSSPYDTMIIDVGTNDGVHTGDRVIAEGFAVGDITRVGVNTSVVTLWSQSGNAFDASVGSVFSGRAEGYGSGDFYMRVPRDTKIQNGDIVRAPALGNVIVGTVSAVSVDEKDPFAEVYIASPLRLRTIRFVEVAAQST